MPAGRPAAGGGGGNQSDLFPFLDFFSSFPKNLASPNAAGNPVGGGAATRGRDGAGRQVSYCNAEQWMMASKARLFNDW